MKKVLILTLIASLTMAASKCVPEAPDFNWSPELFATDFQTQTISRKNQVIKCYEPEFDQFICLKSDEIAKAKRAAFDVINKCERWKKDADPQQIVQQINGVE